VIALNRHAGCFPLATKSWTAHTSDQTTLKEFLAKIEKQYGKANGTWVMDRGIPTEEVLAEIAILNRRVLSGWLAARTAHPT